MMLQNFICISLRESNKVPIASYRGRRHKTVPGSPPERPSAAMVTLKRLQNLEECINELETGSEKVFRRLLQSRVSLPNIHTPF
jgi:hypothetical protein